MSTEKMGLGITYEPPQPMSPVASSWSNATRLFGYDIFISFGLGPPPRGTQSYASDLARRLRELDFTVFYSEDEMPPGTELTKSLAVALHSSKVLVVVANYEVLAEPRWVRKEVESYRSRFPNNPVVPINVAAALQDKRVEEITTEWLPFRDNKWLDESQAAIASGIVSNEVLRQVAMAPRSVKANVKWRWVVRLVTAALATLVAISLWQSDAARQNAARAIANERVAKQNEARAVSSESLAKQKESEARDNEARALSNENLAKQKEEEARANETRAVSSEQLAKQREAEARAQLQRSTALRLSAEARSTLAGLRPESDLSAIWDLLAAYALSADASIFGDLQVAATRHRKVLKLSSIDTPFTTAIGMSHDLTRMIIGTRNGEVEIWDALGGKRLSKLERLHSGTVFSVAFDDDGCHSLSAASDGTLVIRDSVGAKVQIDRPAGERQAINSAAFDKDGSRIITASTNGSVQIWDARNGKLVKNLLELATPVFKVGLSPDGQILATNTSSGLRLWNVSSGRPIGDEFISGAYIHAFSRDGTRVALGGPDSRIRVVNLASERSVLEPLVGDIGVVLALTFSPDGRYLVSVGGGPATGRTTGGELIYSDKLHRAFFIWDLASGALVSSPLDDHTRPIKRVAFTPAGDQILAESEGIVYRIEAPGTTNAGEVPELKPKWMHSRVISPDRTRILATVSGRDLQIFAVPSRERIGDPLTIDINGATASAFSPDGAVLVTGGSDGLLRVWDARTGRQVGDALKAASGGFYKIAFDRKGQRFVASGVDKSLSLWTIEPVREVWSTVNEDGPVTGIAFSPDDNRLVVGTRGNGLRFLDPRTGKPTSDLKLGHSTELGIQVNHEVRVLAFDHTGNRLVSASSDTSLRIWETSTFSPTTGAILGQDDQVVSVSFSPDDAYFATVGAGEVRLWDSVSGRAVGTPLARGIYRPAAVFFEGDGRRVSLMTYTGEAREWNVLRGWAEKLCGIAGNMPPEIWAIRVGTDIGYRRQCPG